MNWTNIIVKGIFFILAVFFAVAGIIYIMGQTPLISTDSFIGIAVTLIGIIVTFAIGFQIVNALDLKKNIEINKDKVDNKLQKINETEEAINMVINHNRIVNHSVIEYENKYNSVVIVIRYNNEIVRALFNFNNKNYIYSMNLIIVAMNIFMENKSITDSYLIIGKNALKGFAALTLIESYSLTTENESHRIYLPNALNKDGEFNDIIMDIIEFSDKKNNIEDNPISKLQKKYESEILDFKTGCPF